MDFNALDQGDQGGSQGDEMGFDLDPVTDPASEKDGHAEPAPNKEEPAPKADDSDKGKEQGAADRKPDNASSKERRVADRKLKVTQEEWQKTKDQADEVPALRQELERSRFEAKNSVVLSQEWEPTWERYCAMKSDPDHEYHKLSFESLKVMMLGKESGAIQENAEVEEELSAPKPPTPPAFGSSQKAKNPGNVDDDVYAALKERGYSDKQIEESDRLTLA